jgi:hypothetical protein
MVYRTFGMDVDFTCVPEPGTMAPDDFASCVNAASFQIYDETCKLRSSYKFPDCGAPFIIEENFLKDVMTVQSVNMDVGAPSFTYLYGNGKFSIGNNGCVCNDNNNGLKAGTSCRCAFPLDGNVNQKRAISFEA